MALSTMTRQKSCRPPRLVLMGALQFSHPTLGSGFDSDPQAAAVQRLRVFKMVADHDYWVAGGHLSFPGIGHIRAARNRYFWVPMSYTGTLGKMQK